MANRRILLSLVVIGLVLVVIGTGTYASFTAQTTNPANTFAAGTMTMTNVAGTAVSGSNCTTATANGTCATLFSAGSTALKPGDADKTNTVTITYTGSITAGSFGLYAANYSSKGGSSSTLCTATDPASKINVQLKQGSTVIFPTSGSGYGTLAAFAAAYTSTGTMLSLKGGTNGSGTAGQWATSDQSTFTINVNLDASADNTYQGCQSLADLVWSAA